MLWLISWWNGWIILVTVAHSENWDCELHWQFLKWMKWGHLLYAAWDDGWYEIICACHLISLFQPKALISHHRAMISIHWPKGSGARFAANVQSASERDVMVPGRQKNLQTCHMVREANLYYRTHGRPCRAPEGSGDHRCCNRRTAGGLAWCTPIRYFPNAPLWRSVKEQEELISVTYRAG